MKKIISIIISIVLTVLVFTAASASADISNTFVGLMPAVQAENKADVGRTHKDKQEEAPKEAEACLKSRIPGNRANGSVRGSDIPVTSENNYSKGASGCLLDK